MHRVLVAERVGQPGRALRGLVRDAYNSGAGGHRAGSLARLVGTGTTLGDPLTLSIRATGRGCTDSCGHAGVRRRTVPAGP